MLKPPSRRAALAGLLLMAGPAAAQTVPPVAKPMPASAASVAPPKAVPAVDPQVTALFKQMLAAHQALTALTETITVSKLQGGTTVTHIVTVAYQKPYAVKLTLSDSTGLVGQVFGDNAATTIYRTKSKTYQVEPAPLGTDTIPAVLSLSRSTLVGLTTSPALLESLLALPHITARIVHADYDQKYNWGAVDTVAVILPSANGRFTYTFAIGSTDHLLRQVAGLASDARNGKLPAFSETETVTALSTTPTLTAADFVFTPPAGVKKIVAPKASANPAMHDPRLVAGAKPFVVTARDLNGKPLTLAQYKGKVVLMDFWATWCGPCVGEMPNVIVAYKKYHAQGFDIIGVSLDQSRPALTGFIAQNKMPWRQVFDGKGWGSAVPREYGVQSIPFGLLIGRDGKIAAVDVRGPALTMAISEALAK